MLHNILRDNAGWTKTPEEFVSFLADLSVEGFSDTQRRACITVLGQVKGLGQESTGESGLDILRPVQEVVGRV